MFLGSQCKKLGGTLEKTDESITALIRLCVPRSFSLKLVRILSLGQFIQITI